MSSPTYTSIFGVGLLDDLHNYFPDILYNNRRFSTFHDMLDYIQEQSRQRFNLMDYGRRQWLNAANNTPSNHVLSGHETSAAPNTYTYSYSYPNHGASGSYNYSYPNQGASGSYNYSNTSNIINPINPITSNIPISTDTSSSNIQTPVQDISGNTTATPLRVRTVPVNRRNRPSVQSSIQYFTTPTYRSSIFGDESYELSLLPSLLNILQHPVSQFADVVVFPTNEQIHSATTVQTLTEPLEDACTICQDEMEAGASVRRINRCNHSFHNDCIMHWFEQSCYCPICRTDIRPS
jgi:hypothetical protein